MGSTLRQLRRHGHRYVLAAAPEKIYLFNYGSNHPDQLQQRVGRVAGMVGAYADGWRRVFRGWSRNWNGGVATLVKARHRTFGYIAEVTAAQLDQMDRYEGVASGNYRRATLTVTTTADDRRTAIVYLSNSDEFNTPSVAYLDAVAKTVGSFWAGVTRSSFPVR